MANFVLNLLPSSNFDQQLRSGTFRSVSEQLIRRITSRALLISTQIGDFLAGEFNKTVVAISLRGFGVVDLQGHFGLSESLANQLVDGMANLIRKSVVIQTNIVSQKAIIRIRAVESDWLKYTQLPGAEYISKRSGIVIPVVRWMLIDPDIDIGQAAYQIVFAGEEGGKFNKSIQDGSRSGRAIMVSLEDLGGGTPYVLPDIIRGNFGENFIEFSLGQPGIPKKVFDIVIQNL